MKNTNTKAIVEKNQNHLIRHLGGKKGFVYQVGGQGSVRDVITSGLTGVIYKEDAYRYLRRLGIPKEDLVGKDPYEMYLRLMVRDGTRLYEKIKREDFSKAKIKRSIKK